MVISLRYVYDVEIVTQLRGRPDRGAEIWELKGCPWRKVKAKFGSSLKVVAKGNVNQFRHFVGKQVRV